MTQRRWVLISGTQKFFASLDGWENPQEERNHILWKNNPTTQHPAFIFLNMKYEVPGYFPILEFLQALHASTCIVYIDYIVYIKPIRVQLSRTILRPMLAFRRARCMHHMWSLGRLVEVHAHRIWCRLPCQNGEGARLGTCLGMIGLTGCSLADVERQRNTC